MIGFGVGATLLLVLALMFVLPPLVMRRGRLHGASHDEANVSVYRDQLQELDADLAAGTITADRHRQARQEIEKRLLDETRPEPAAGGGKGRSRHRGGRRTALAVGLLLPILVIGMYVQLGDPRGLDPRALVVAQQEQAHQLTPEQILGMAQNLAERLKQNPEDAEGWIMLARSYAVLERFEDAAKAYAVAIEQNPNNAQLYADYADALGMTRGRTLAGEPEKLVERALQIDPLNIKGLALAGTAAFQRKEYANAAEYWRRILALIPEESEFAQSIRGSMMEARSLAGNTVAQVPSAAAVAVAGAVSEAAANGVATSAATADASKPASAATVKGVVRLSPALAAKVAPGDSLFIYARAAEGPRMPLAIKRMSAKDLPARFSLDDSMAMAPNLALSKFSKVIVGARISKTGDALPQPGDLQGHTQAVRLGAADLEIVIDSEVAAAPATTSQAPAQPAAPTPKAGTSVVKGTVRLSPALAAKVGPGDAVFIFARALDGPRMPLAIKRVVAKELPLAFALDESMAMTPNLTLAHFPKVIVGARVSRTGDALPRPGDFEGYSQPVAVGATGLEVVIDAEVKPVAGAPMQQAAQPPTAAPAAAPRPLMPSPQLNGPGGVVKGMVRLSPALQARVAPGDTLYVYARAAEGPRMPLAIKRGLAKELPLEFSLDDSMAMAPGMNLSRFPKVVVGARISKSGNATAQPGDLQGATAAVDVGSTGLQITIDSEVR